MKSYTDLDVWKLARILVKDIYQLSATFPREEIYNLVSQMRRCAVSIPSNIAEGHGRNHSKDTIQFLYIARGSLYELETQLLISFDLGYCLKENLDVLLEKVINCRQMLNGLIRYFEKIK
jgi:four helix bundle protein